MKKQLLVAAIAAASTLAFSSAVAEDSLTLYGKLNRAIFNADTTRPGESESTSEGRVGGYGNSSDRLGFVAKEQLSTHWHAVAKYELGFGNAGNAGGQLGFNRTRHAYLALNHDSVGTFSLGQTWNSHYISTDFYGASTSIFYDKLLAYTASSGGRNNFTRIGNSAFYVSPRWGGLFTVAANYTNNDDLPSNLGNKEFDFGVTLDAGQLTIGLATSHVVVPVANSVDDRADVTSFAIGYNFAGESWFFNPSLIYQTYELDQAGADTTTDLDNTHIGLELPFGWGNNRITLLVSQTSDNDVGGTTDNDSGADYALIEYGYQITKRTKFNVGYETLSTGAGGGSGNSTDVDTFAVGFGHNF